MNNKNSLKPSVEEKMAATTSSNVAGGNKKPPLLRVDAILNDEMDMRSIPSSSICSLNHLNVAQTVSFTFFIAEMYFYKLKLVI